MHNLPPDTYVARQIRADMVLRGLTVKGIAKKVGVSSTSVSQTIYGRIRSPRIRAAIAQSTGRSVEDYWPPAETRAA